MIRSPDRAVGEVIRVGGGLPQPPLARVECPGPHGLVLTSSVAFWFPLCAGLGELLVLEMSLSFASTYEVEK